MIIKLNQAISGVDFNKLPGEIINTSDKDSKLTLKDAQNYVLTGVAEEVTKAKKAK